MLKLHPAVVAILDFWPTKWNYHLRESYKKHTYQVTTLSFMHLFS